MSPDIVTQVAQDVATSLAHNWPYLTVGVVVASVVQVYVGSDRLAATLRGRTALAVLGAVALATLTPFCSCGTTAVVLGAMASSVPWAPVVAFMVSSPLTSPSEYVVSAGLFGVPFATTFFVAAIVIGVLSGAVAHALERAGVLAGQARMQAPAAGVAQVVGAAGAAGAGEAAVASGPSAGAVTCCEAAPVTTAPADPPRSAEQFLTILWRNARTIMVYFLAFAAIGFLIIHLVPTSTLTTYLGGGSAWSVPLAATLGIPVYVSSEASLPLIASLVAGGMGPGPALAFLLTGAGTSIGAISGMLTIARWRIIALVVGSLWVGAVVVGWLAPLWL